MEAKAGKGEHDENRAEGREGKRRRNECVDVCTIIVDHTTQEGRSK